MRYSKRMGHARLIAFIGLASLGLAACSAVQSINVSNTDVDLRKDAYLNYSVAKSLFTIQVTAASSSAAAPATAPLSLQSPAAAPAAAGAAPTSWNLSGTLTAGGGAQSGSANKAPTPNDSSACAVLNAEYAAAQTEVAGAISSYAVLKVRLAQFAAGRLAKDASKGGGADSGADLSKDLTAYYNLVNSDAYQKMMMTNGGVPTQNDKVPKPGLWDRIDKECPVKVTVSIAQIIVPDRSQTFALKPRTNPFYSDTLALTTDANGFLTNNASTTASQVTSIASAIANDIGLVTPAGVSAPVVAEAAAARGRKPAVAANPCPRDTLLNKIKALATCKDPAVTAEIATEIESELISPGSLPNLPSAALPITVYASIEDLDVATPRTAGSSQPATADATPTIPQPVSGRDALDYLEQHYSVTTRMWCSGRAEPQNQTPAQNTFVENPPVKTDTGKAATPGIYDGLVVSASRACLFEATQKRPNKDPINPNAPDRDVVIAHSNFWAQDSRYLTILPTDRGFLVTNNVAYTFANGQATGATDSRPSEVLAVVSFPGTVIGSFFSGVTSAFTNDNTYTVGKTTSLTDQTNYLTARANYLAAKAALEKAQAPASASPSN